MVKVILHGCGGKMCRMVSEMCATDTEISVVAGVDISGQGAGDYPVFKNIEDCNVPADVMIDFSDASAVDGLLDYCMVKHLPVVLCTTGLSPVQFNHVREAANETAVLRSSNMTLGINLLMKLVKEAAKILATAGFDIEIVEKHHNQKLDAPSGTAIALADSIDDELGNEFDYVYDRSQKREPRNKKEIGISAVRGGTIVGDHDVIFAGEDEVITFSHRAYSKAVFAKGAIQAAKFLADITSNSDYNIGLYSMSDVIDE